MKAGALEMAADSLPPQPAACVEGRDLAPMEARPHAPRTARRLGLGLPLSALMVLAACDTSEPTKDRDRSRAEADDDDDDDSTADDDDSAADDDDDDDDEVTDARVRMMDARVPDAQAMTDARIGSDASITVSDAGVGIKDAGIGMKDGGPGTKADAASPGPVVLPAPDKVGPYEAIEEENVGKGFENPVNANDMNDTACLSFINSFGQDEETNREYAAIPPGHNMALYTLYRPKEFGEGERLPALSWANGTCAHPVGYAGMIKHIVSHGFIVIASHSRYTGTGAEQIRGIDFLEAENENPDSPLFGHVDTDRIGVFGHSQGGASTSIAGADPRVKSVILMHGSAGASFDAPVLLLCSDIEALLQYPTYLGASGPAAYAKLNNSDHITMMLEPERMAPEVTAWFRYTLLDDDVARGWFAGPNCVLCGDSEWEYEAKNLK